MTARSEIIGYSKDRRRMLAVMCRSADGPSPQDAADQRRLWLELDAIPAAPYFLLAFPTDLFIWLEQTPADQLPDFSASSRSILRTYLGKRAESGDKYLNNSLEYVWFWWLADLAGEVRLPDPNSEADQMIVMSGLYDRIRLGRVRFEEQS